MSMLFLAHIYRPFFPFPFFQLLCFPRHCATLHVIIRRSYSLVLFHATAFSLLNSKNIQSATAITPQATATTAKTFTCTTTIFASRSSETLDRITCFTYDSLHRQQSCKTTASSGFSIENSMVVTEAILSVRSMTFEMRSVCFYEKIVRIKC